MKMGWNFGRRKSCRLISPVLPSRSREPAEFFRDRSLFSLFHFSESTAYSQLLQNYPSPLSYPSSKKVSTLRHIGAGAWRSWREPATLTARPGVRLLVRKVRLIRVSSLLQACCKDYGNNVGEAVGVSSERPLSTSHRSQ